MDESTTTGPLISKEHRDKVLAYYQLAREEGATIVTGGGVPNLMTIVTMASMSSPTILTGLPESARCVKEEIFGPVCHVAPFDTEEEAVAIANDTQIRSRRFGLDESNLKRGHRVAE